MFDKMFGHKQVKIYSIGERGKSYIESSIDYSSPKTRILNALEENGGLSESAVSTHTGISLDAVRVHLNRLLREQLVISDGKEQ